MPFLLMRIKFKKFIYMCYSSRIVLANDCIGQCFHMILCIFSSLNRLFLLYANIYDLNQIIIFLKNINESIFILIIVTIAHAIVTIKISKAFIFCFTSHFAIIQQIHTFHLFVRPVFL
jgi:hypothetical protein